MLCRSEQESGASSLDVITLSDLAVVKIAVAPGGGLRGASNDIAVVVPGGGDTEASWIAGVDLATGAEIWRKDRAAFGEGYITADGHLVQASLVTGNADPEFMIDVIDLQSGASRRLYTERTLSPGGLWRELSTDNYVVVGPDTTIGSALMDSADGQVLATVLDVASGMKVSGVLPIGGT